MTKSKRKEELEAKILEKYHQSKEYASILKKTDHSEADDVDQSKSISQTQEQQLTNQANQVFNKIDEIRKENKKKFTKLKKKLKKKQRQQKQQQQSTSENLIDETKEGKSQKALAYLKLWKRHRDQWKYKKILHIWLLKNWKDPNKLPDKRFKTFLKYLSVAETKTNGKERLKKDAQSLIDNSNTSETVLERSRSILQWLT